MSKLVTMCLLVVLVFGAAAYVFRPGSGGMQSDIRSGHDTMTRTIRSFDYITD
ncbi:hypothetical protein [Paenibacillus sp. YYML68]|uniref:hypothetical protein n=1 Tax=Paenibacillus sp. YYML68 TaxID=2909250 RepID=UPI002492EA92|nr:hypothetical protein [Paenibacillus sp. YYML68]